MRSWEADLACQLLLPSPLTSEARRFLNKLSAYVLHSDPCSLRTPAVNGAATGIHRIRYLSNTYRPWIALILYRVRDLPSW